MYLRTHHYFGARKSRCTWSAITTFRIGSSGIWRILNELELSRLSASQRSKRHWDRYKRYEQQLPGQRVRVNVKFIQPIGVTRKKHDQFNAIDDCTRIRVLRA